jgi:hypothetical protein
MKRFFVCVTLAAVLMTDGTLEAEAYTSIGAGAESCGAWTSARHTRSFQVMQWALGFLSGVGFVGRDSADPLRGMDAEGVWAWIDNYCQANPIKDVVDAAEAFYDAHPHR